jgi:uncharacterized protein YgbK (DUF1537 family)
MDQLSLEILSQYPTVDAEWVNDRLYEALSRLDRKIIVLDDDPAGVQTVNHLSVYTGWDEESIRAGFYEDSSIFFILTNSRSLTREDTIQIHQDIAHNLVKVAQETGKNYILISRSDSTMRGHYPVETETLRNVIEQDSARRFDGEIIIPFFQEGGRYTIENVHYNREGNVLMPVGQTEYAKDVTFAYRHSHLGEYIEEKTGGKYKKEYCTYISLDDIRHVDINQIAKQLMAVKDFNKVVVNAIDYIDAKIFAIAFCQAIQHNKEFIFRSAAGLTKILGGVPDQPLLTKSQLIREEHKNGGIILIGSHVNRTTLQLEKLRTSKIPLAFIEFNQHLVLVENGLHTQVDRIVAEVERHIQKGNNVVVYTRRERFDLDTEDKYAQLRISTQISNAVSSIVSRLSIRPSFIIAKGGITSSDVGTKSLGVKKALVIGQIIPGVPVWKIGAESKFPDMPFIIFPGNVGNVDALKEIVELLQ